MLTFISGSLMGKTIKEEIYSCTNNFGEVAVRVFFNPKVYCQEKEWKDLMDKKKSFNGGETKPIIKWQFMHDSWF